MGNGNIDLEHCTILGNETVDANSLNRCMFNLFRKMEHATSNSVEASSENLPESPFFSGGYDNALTDIDYISSMSGAVSATSERSGLVARLYKGNLDIDGSQNDPSFSTESVSGTYYYGADELSSFAPTVKTLFNDDAQRILGPVISDDSTTMIEGVSSLGIASSPIVKFTSYMTCAKSGISFGTISFNRNNGDRQDNVITLNISRDLVGIEGIDTVDFMTIGNGYASGVRTVSEGLDMVSDIGQCTITYLSNNDIAITDITKSDNSNSIFVERDSGKIVDHVEFGEETRYVELPNDEVVLNFFIIFTLKDEVLEYSDDLWCFYIVKSFDYGRRYLNDASRWAMDYFKYGFDNFEAADDGMEGIDGSHIVDAQGCVTDATDAFNGCYNASFKSLSWFSPVLAYADRMFKGCTHATFDSLSSNLGFPKMRSAVSMFERCKEAKFSNVVNISLPTASQLGLMFANCDKASFDLLRSIEVAGNANKMFYNDFSADFKRLEGIYGTGTRFTSMFERCDNASFDVLTAIQSDETDLRIDASRMFYGLKKPTFDGIVEIELSYTEAESHAVCGYDGVSMFEGCENATFENLTSVGYVVDGTRMFASLDPIHPSLIQSSNDLSHAVFDKLHSLGPLIANGSYMFSDDYYLDMTITDENCPVIDGTAMFRNTSSVVFTGNLPNLVTAYEMMSHICHAEVQGDMKSLKNGASMFLNDDEAIVLGQMPVLDNARSMFEFSKDVTVTTFPSSVSDAMNSFASVTGKADVFNWEEAAVERNCDEAFFGSANVAITGDVIAGKTVSTSHMFDSVSGLKLYNAEYGETNEVSSKWYYFDSTDHYAYVQKFTADGETDGNLIFIGNATPDNIGELITEELSGQLNNSLMVFAELRENKLTYSVYSASADYTSPSEPAVSMTLECSGLNFNEPLAERHYAYMTVSGYTSDKFDESSTLMISRSQDSGTRVTYNLLDESNSDSREFVTSGTIVDGYSFTEKVGSNIRMSGIITYTDNSTITISMGGEFKSFDVGGNADISFDFSQFETSDGLGAHNIPHLTVIAKGDDRTEICAIVPSADGTYGQSHFNADVTADELLMSNAPSKPFVRAIEVYRYDGNEQENPYGYLIEYVDNMLDDYRVGFKKRFNVGDALEELLSDPKRSIDGFSFMAAHIFSDYNIEKDIGACKPENSRVRTNFLISNAEGMMDYWKDADYMFYGVVEDSLLSGYYCLTHDSLEDVSYMYALLEKVDDDHTFDNSGPLLAKLPSSNVKSMDGMFENRTVSYPLIFTDINGSIGSGETKFSFQLPNGVTTAASAFHNCTISDTYMDGTSSVNEIGLTIPSTLVNANGMFDGYSGPKIHFGYNSNGYVTLGDGLQCDRMFYGCEFTNTTSDKFGFSIPSIYLNMFDGSDFAMSNVTSIDVRNGMNFATPYSDDEFFNNDMKILGCSSLSFESLVTDVLDWFCTDTYAVEGSYLATVVGPKNNDGMDGDYRMMDGEKNDDVWTTTMAKNERFATTEKMQTMMDATNAVKLDSVTELSNPLGRMTSMFNLPVLFERSSFTGGSDLLGSQIAVSIGHKGYKNGYEKYGTVDFFIGKSYNSTTFGGLKSLNALEMPLSFAGCSSATFESIEDIGPSPVVAYGTFIGCHNATFDSLKNVEFMQYGNVQPDTMTSRFTDNVSTDWYGNYCNMFAGCRSATFGNLENVSLDTRFADYGVDGMGGVFMWHGDGGSVNFDSYSKLNTVFTVSLTAADSGTFGYAITDANYTTAASETTEISTDGISSVNLDFSTFEPTGGGEGIRLDITVNMMDGGEPYRYQYSTDTYDPSTEFTPITSIGHEYFVSADGHENELRNGEHLMLYKDGSMFNTVEVGESFIFDINYNVDTMEEDGRYVLIVKNRRGETVGSMNTDVVVDGRSRFRIETADINGNLSAVVVVTDYVNMEHMFEIMPNGEIRKLMQHPSSGRVDSTGDSPSTIESPFVSAGAYISNLEYSDAYGQQYMVNTGHDERGYVMSLCTEPDIEGNSKEVAVFHTPASFDSLPASSVMFRISPYISEGHTCVIVSIKNGNDGVFYKIFGNYVNDGETYAVVEETIYDPTAPYEYTLLETMEFGDNVAVGGICYCSGMFMNCSSATFDNLSIISLPGEGSCAGMFSNCSSMNLTGLEVMMLPTAKDDEMDYSGLFEGVDVSSIDLSKLSAGTTNIHKLGANGEPTRGMTLFSGMLSGGTETISISSAAMANECLGLDVVLAEQMEWPLL